LAATIKKVRPELLPSMSIENVDPVSEDMPANFFEKNVGVIEGIGEPTNACFFTSHSGDPTNWYVIVNTIPVCKFPFYQNRWMFEKYDGVRGFWNPNTCAMYSRSGKRFSLPPHITDSMPNDMFLDGEMWYVYSLF